MHPLSRYLYQHRFSILVGLGSALLLGIFIAWYVTTEQTVYYWDYSNYWKPTIDLSQQLRTDFFGAIAEIVRSIRMEEYNLIHAVLPAFSMIFFGESRLTYLLTIFVMYFLPTAALLTVVSYSLIAKISTPSESKKRVMLSAILVLTALNPFLLTPLLRGYPDVAGVGLLALALWVYLRYRESFNLKWIFVIAIILVMATLFRRWYIFGSVGVIVAIGIDQIVSMIAYRKESYVTRLKNLLRLSVLPLTYISCFVLVAWPYTYHLLTNDYGSSYAAYKRHDSYLELAGFTIGHFGLLLLLIACFGLGYLLKKRSTRATTGVIIGSSVFSFFAVGAIQSFDWHQYYLLTIPLVVGAAVAPVLLYRWLSAKKQKKWLALTIPSVVVSFVIAVSWFSLFFHYSDMSPFISGSNANRLQRNDMESLRAIYEELGRQTGSIYVLSCSSRFNIDTIRNTPLSIKGVKEFDTTRFMPTTQLDIRDGFDVQFFDADIVVDSDPVGYIATKDQQQVITLLHNEIRHGRLKPYYKLHESYSVDEHRAYIYLRQGDIPTNIQDGIIAKIRGLHQEMRIISKR